MKKAAHRFNTLFVDFRKLKFVLLSVLLISGVSAKAQFDSSVIGPPDLLIDEETTVKFSTITQFYWRFKELPAPGTNVQVWKNGVLYSSSILSSLNMVIEVPTGFEYILKVHGKDVGVINARIAKPKQQVEISGALMSTLTYDQEYLAGTQSILSAMDENTHISYFEKLALIQTHYLKGLPLADIYRLTPEGILTYGYYKSVSGSFPGTDPYDGYGRIQVGNLDMGPTGTGIPMPGQTAGAGYNDGDFWGMSGAPGSDPYILVVINGVWRVFNYKTDCAATITVDKAAFVRNVTEGRGGYISHSSPYEYKRMVVDFVNNGSDAYDNSRHYEELRTHVVMGASMSRFMKQRGYPNWPTISGPDNKFFAYADIGTPNMQYVNYTLTSNSKWNASLCACEIPMTISPQYVGAYEMKTELSPGSGAKSAHAQVLDYAITQVVNQKTGEVLDTRAGIAEGELKCNRGLNPEWVTAFSDVASSFAGVALTAAQLAAGPVPISPTALSKLTDSSLSKYAGSLATLFFTNKYIYAGDCGTQTGDYVLIPPTTHFNTTLKPNETIQIIIASGQRMELKGDHRWESMATLRSRAAMGIFFPQMDATAGSPCCSKAHAAWQHTALTANDSIDNVEFLQALLRSKATWDSKYIGGPFNKLLCYGHSSMAFGKFYPSCSTAVVTYLKKSNENNVTGQANGFLAQNFPNPFSVNTEIRYLLPEETKMAMISIYDVTGRTVNTYPVSTINKEGAVTINSSELQPGIYFYKLLVNGNTFDTKQMVFAN